MKFTLKEKQEYYRYPDHGITRKDQPILDPEVARWMKHSRLDENYRFVFLGVDIERIAEDDDSPIIHGDINATYNPRVRDLRVVNGIMQPFWRNYLMPKALFTNTRRTRCWTYLNDKGETVSIPRPDLVVTKALVTPVYEYHSFGQLRWRVERLVGEQWYSIMTLHSPEKLYQEPNLALVEHLLVRRQQDMQNSERELALLTQSESEERAKLKQMEEEDEAQKDRVAIETVTTDMLDMLHRGQHTVS